jgi:hypothetical protein
MFGHQPIYPIFQNYFTAEMHILYFAMHMAMVDLLKLR